ncbi:unnamed protein product [Clonostachys rosea]|uniref:FAD-binding FR-type domain-containing protein n=1 Tax=Bionectria ochroleuca TaxID=29856 RepID=A0ABY6U262_BIOOC|nr:unnamed protein product [Clonostachys rosea]
MVKSCVLARVRNGVAARAFETRLTEIRCPRTTSWPIRRTASPSLSQSVRSSGGNPRLYSTTPSSIPRKKPRRSGRILAIGLVFGGILYYYTTSPSSSKQTTLNSKTFVPYQITSREALSSSSFVISITPQNPDPNPPYLLPSSSGWRHPLWSVEFKQPEVQISRHYTPLPPSPNSEEDKNGVLRFYIRAVGDGEMSNYLSRLRVGQDVWLRGPHVGFDLVNRLGASKSIVFLAGGTGIVPGMQAAQVALDGYQDTSVSLLWAVRKRQEVQAAAPSSTGPCWWEFWKSGREPTELGVDVRDPGPVARQLAEMKARYGSRIDVQVVVDEEGSSFNLEHIRKALLQTTEGYQPSASVTGPRCFLHSQKLHEEASEFESDSPRCSCAPTEGALPGKNLFIVSGPDGFVSHYAGSKVWQGGKHTQGPLGGIAAQIQSLEPRLASEWLVLKL